MTNIIYLRYWLKEWLSYSWNSLTKILQSWKPTKKIQVQCYGPKIATRIQKKSSTIHESTLTCTSMEPMMSLKFGVVMAAQVCTLMRRSPSLLVYNRALWTYSTGSGVTFSWADVQNVQRDGMKKMILLEKIHVIWVKHGETTGSHLAKHLQTPSKLRISPLCSFNWEHQMSSSSIH